MAHLVGGGAHLVGGGLRPLSGVENSWSGAGCARGRESGSVAHRSGVGRTWSGAGFARGRGQWRTLVGGGEQLVGVSSTLGRGQ